MENTNFKIYDVGNLGSGKSNLFIGNTYISDVTKNKNDFSTFLFASLVGGRNIRIDQATEKDPYIFIDARFYTFKPYNYYVSLSNNEPLSNLEATYGNTSDVYLKTIIKNITTVSGDVAIHIKNLEVDSKLTFYKNSTDNEIVIKTADYNLKNTTESKAIKILDSKQKDSFGNTSFVIKKLIEGNCLKFDQILEFTWEDIFSSSVSSSISSISSSSALESSVSSSSALESSVSSQLIQSESNEIDSSSSQPLECCNLAKVTDIKFNIFYGSISFNWEDVGPFNTDYDYNDHVSFIRGPLNVVPGEIPGTYRLYALKSGVFTFYTARGAAGNCHEVTAYVNNIQVAFFGLSNFGQDPMVGCGTNEVTYPTPAYKTFFANEGDEIKLKLRNLNQQKEKFHYEMYDSTHPAAIVTDTPPPGFLFPGEITWDAQFNIPDDCQPAEKNLREILEKNVTGILTINRLNLDTKLYFPENLYNVSVNNYFLTYFNETIFDSKSAVVRYNVIENAFYQPGVRLYGIIYTKTSPNLIRHEIRDPASVVYDTFNNIATDIPLTNFDKECIISDLSDSQIYSAVISMLDNKLFIDTERDGYPSYTLGDASFQQAGITNLGVGKYQVLFKFDDGEDVNTDGILEVIVEKCYILDTNYTTIGQLEMYIGTEECCNENPIFENYYSDSSSSSISSSSPSSSSSSSSISSSSPSSSSNGLQDCVGWSGIPWLDLNAGYGGGSCTPFTPIDSTFGFLPYKDTTLTFTIPQYCNGYTCDPYPTGYWNAYPALVYSEGHSCVSCTPSEDSWYIAPYWEVTNDGNPIITYQEFSDGFINITNDTLVDVPTQSGTIEVKLHCVEFSPTHPTGKIISTVTDTFNWSITYNGIDGCSPEASET